jgi:hypothetical protein
MWTPTQVLDLTIPQVIALNRQSKKARGADPDATATPGEIRRFLRSFGG